MIDVDVKLLFTPSAFSSTSSSSFSPTRTMPSSDAPLLTRDASGYSAYQESSNQKSQLLENQLDQNTDKS